MPLVDRHKGDRRSPFAPPRVYSFEPRPICLLNYVSALAEVGATPEEIVAAVHCAQREGRLRFIGCFRAEHLEHLEETEEYDHVA